MKNLPGLKAESPLSKIKSLTFVIYDLEDARPHFSSQVEIFNPKPTEIIKEAITNELMRNGHKVLNMADANRADVMIHGDVRCFNFDFYHKPYVFNIETKLAITTNYNSDNPLIKVYRGKVEFKATFVNKRREFASIALLEMIKEFTSDPNFLDVLQEINKS